MRGSLGRGVSFGPFRLYAEARVLERDGVRLVIGSRALDILIVLVDRAGQVVSHGEFTQRVWRGLVVAQGSLRVHVAALRKALGDGNEGQRYIANVPGQGYCFVAPIHDDDGDADSALPATFRKAAEADGIAPRAAPRHNLPNQLTSFIGREKELAQLKKLLASTRLLTLTGAGGCGKTRLALQVTAELVEGFVDGCWLIELAPLTEPALVVQTVANVFAVKEQANTSLEAAIVERLSTKCLLLILDNAEHLVQACAELADLLLRRCSHVQVLVTSREPLGVSGEWTYRVPSLSVPEADATVEGAMACEATRLFIERARLHDAAFAVAAKDVRTLISICRRLDGIALAIELAAPRVRAMSIQELNRRLDDRFGILTGGHRNVLSRHRTLRSLIDWSYDLLGPAEKTMLRRVAVFAGGFTVDAADFLCAGDGIGQCTALDLLTGLTDKSILVVETHEDSTRFGMLETLRHYAWERLRESGEEEAIRARHLEFFLTLAERLDEAQDDAQRTAQLRRMDLEHDNVRAALAWSEATRSRRTRGLRLAGALDWFWTIRGHFGEGFGWVTRLLELCGPDAWTGDHAAAHHTAGRLAFHKGEPAAAERHHLQALAIFQRLGQRRRIARSLGNLGSLARDRGDHAAARQYYEQGLDIAREVGDRRSIAVGLHCLGLAALDMEDFAAAQAYLEEGIAVARELGQWSVANIQGALGAVRRVQGDLQGARQLFIEVLDAGRAFGDKIGIAWTLTELAIVSHGLGDLATAKAQLREALAIEEAMNVQKYLPFTLEVFAGVAMEIAGPCDAARLFGQAERLREEIGGGFPGWPAGRAWHERAVAAARGASNDGAAFDRAWGEGRAMTPAEAVLCAMRV